MPAAVPRWLFVFSHPNHEIAVFGHLQRLRPAMVFLTDGGGPERVAETRRGLERLDLLDQAHFLDRPEQALYQALLAQDHGFWRQLAREVADAIGQRRPERIAADAVEFYNPVHDMALPVAQAALALSGQQAELYEVPLIFQRAGADAKGYAVQTSVTGGAQLKLTPEEWAAKITSWREIYGQLRGQLGSVIAALEPEVLGIEVLHPARDAARRPEPGETLRYEVRGRLLAEQGAVREVIGLDSHVQPVVRRLLAACAAA
jgi:hypothetical protein